MANNIFLLLKRVNNCRKQKLHRKKYFSIQDFNKLAVEYISYLTSSSAIRHHNYLLENSDLSIGY